ncbi:restriction endonuclease subunit S [Clostridium sp.]|uniref:restriction endonuclease subunit S n=1 Tax=Clostridium sp. TaxID=1506 RepID=UPI0028FFC5B6|nr:restriction endonuclease subunit S [Clostridium sp.]MDU2283516.1 restriction endonuclease subunit S [Clostridium sp.]
MIYNETEANKHWDTKKLSQLGKFKRGKSKHRPRNDKQLFVNGTYPLIQTGEVKNANLYINKHNATYNDFGLTQSKLWDTGTLCITIAANIAETAILAYPMCFPDSVVGFIANKEETSELFMHYVFAFIRQAIQNSVNGSIQDNIDMEYLSGLSFKIPHKSHQDKIVNLLSSIDKKIEINLKIQELLDEELNLIYNKWFLQYDFPVDDGKSYREANGKMKWNERFEMEIPSDWQVVDLGDYIDFNKGISYTSDDIKSGEGIPMINLASIDVNLSYRPDQLKYFNGNITEEKMVVKNDMIIACTDLTRNANIIGFPIFVPDTFPRFTYSTDLVKVIIQDEKLKPEFLFSTLRTPFYHKYIKGFATGTNVLHLDVDGIKWYPIILPTKSVQEKYGEIVRGNIEKQNVIIRENQKLKKYRDFLLPLLMNGQVAFK